MLTGQLYVCVFVCLFFFSCFYWGPPFFFCRFFFPPFDFYVYSSTYGCAYVLLRSFFFMFFFFVYLFQFSGLTKKEKRGLKELNRKKETQTVGLVVYGEKKNEDHICSILCGVLPDSGWLVCLRWLFFFFGPHTCRSTEGLSLQTGLLRNDKVYYLQKKKKVICSVFFFSFFFLCVFFLFVLPSSFADASARMFRAAHTRKIIYFWLAWFRGDFKTVTTVLQ